MATDIRAKNIRLTIGGNDWSDNLVQATLQWSELDVQGGIIKGSAAITLDVSEIVPLPSYRTDPDQWAKGTAVLIEVKDSLGAWVIPPMGRLVIGEVPSPPSISKPTIDLICVCVLTLFDFNHPDGDGSGVTVGVSRDRDLIVASILAKNGLSNSLNSIPYPLDYPIPKTSGSWVNQAGEIAASGGHFLYQDNDGVVKNKAIALTGSPIATVTIGSNEAEWEPSISPEQVVEKLVVAGVKYDVNSVGGTSVFSEVLGYKSDVYQFFQGTYDEYVGVLERTTVSDSGFDPATRSTTITTTKELPAIAISPRSVIWTSPEAFDLYVAEQTIDVSYYGSAGELIRQVCTTVKPKISISIRSVLLSDAFTLVPAEEITTTVFYTANYQVNKVEVVTKSPKGIVLPLDTSPSDFYTLIEATKEESTWADFGANNWLWVKKSFKIAPPEYEIISANNTVIGIKTYPGLELQNTETTFANDGSTNPPQTTYLKKNELKEIAINACVNFTGLESDPYGERTRLININYANSAEQLYAFGSLFNGILWGRRYGWRVGMPVTDALLSATPLDIVSVNDNGVTYSLLIDGLTFVFTGQEAYAAFNGIEIGVDGIPAYKEVIDATLIGAVPIAMSATGTISGNVMALSVGIFCSGTVTINKSTAVGAMNVVAEMTGMAATLDIFTEGLPGIMAITSTGLKGQVPIVMSGGVELG